MSFSIASARRSLTTNGGTKFVYVMSSSWIHGLLFRHHCENNTITETPITMPGTPLGTPDRILTNGAISKTTADARYVDAIREYTHGGEQWGKTCAEIYNLENDDGNSRQIVALLAIMNYFDGNVLDGYTLKDRKGIPETITIQNEVKDYFVENDGKWFHNTNSDLAGHALAVLGEGTRAGGT